MRNTKRPLKKEFIEMIKPLNLQDRQNIILELLEIVEDKLKQPGVKRQLHRATVSEMVHIKGEFNARLKLGYKNIFKLYVVACYPPQEINHWVMDKNNCYRMKTPQRDRFAKAKRTPSIRDVNGDVIPIQYRKKFIPPWVKTQTEYELYCSNAKYYNTLWKKQLGDTQ